MTCCHALLPFSIFYLHLFKPYYQLLEPDITCTITPIINSTSIYKESQLLYFPNKNCELSMSWLTFSNRDSFCNLTDFIMSVWALERCLPAGSLMVRLCNSNFFVITTLEDSHFVEFQHLLEPFNFKVMSWKLSFLVNFLLFYNCIDICFNNWGGENNKFDL